MPALILKFAGILRINGVISAVCKKRGF